MVLFFIRITWWIRITRGIRIVMSVFLVMMLSLFVMSMFSASRLIESLFFRGFFIISSFFVVLFLFSFLWNEFSWRWFVETNWSWWVSEWSLDSFSWTSFYWISWNRICILKWLIISRLSFNLYRCNFIEWFLNFFLLSWCTLDIIQCFMNSFLMLFLNHFGLIHSTWDRLNVHFGSNHGNSCFNVKCIFN